MDRNDRAYKKQIIAKRVAKLLHDGDFVNLGIGIPTLVADYIPEGISVQFQTENGLMGVGPAPEAGKEDPECINAGGGFITTTPGAAFFDSAYSFALIRGGHINMTVLGALEVAGNGDLANWKIPGKMVPGMGGAMDLLTGAENVVVAMEHCNKKGKSKILKECSLPLTAKGKVTIIVTEMAFIRITAEGAVLEEVADGYTVEDVKAATEAELIIPEKVGTFYNN